MEAKEREQVTPVHEENQYSSPKIQDANDKLQVFRGSLDRITKRFPQKRLDKHSASLMTFSFGVPSKDSCHSDELTESDDHLYGQYLNLFAELDVSGSITNLP